MNSPRLSIDKWRLYISRTLWVITVSTLLAELVICLMFRFTINQEIGFPLYLARFILLPTGLNLTCAAINHYIQKSGKTSETVKNYSVAIGSAFLAFIISYFHYISVLALAAFIFPIFITVLFGNKTITRNITILSTILIAIAILHALALTQSKYFIIEILVAYVLLANSFYIANVLMNYIRQNNQCICDGYITEQVLIEKAKTDPLTGLYNHSIFMKTLEDCVEQYHKDQTPFCVAMIDIDNFKLVNDTYGHLAGNLVLIELAGLLKELKKAHPEQETFLFRYGGEEFGIIFKDQKIDKAYEKVDRLREGFSAIKFPSMADRQITFSAGITEFKGDSILEDLFNTADAALYRSKDCGKNQTSIL